jgi:hypothetical protein
MAVKIIAIEPKPNTVTSEDQAISAHISIKQFKWLHEETAKVGTSSQEIMFDWIVNKKGRAYVNVKDSKFFVYGTKTAAGQQYIRCLDPVTNTWTNEMLSLPAVEL